MAPRDAAREYLACNHLLGRRLLADVDGLDGFVDAASTVIDAAEGHALALFAGVRGRAGRAGSRRHPGRGHPSGDGASRAARERHLAAVAAVGLDSAVAHAIKRPDDVASFGYDEPPVVTDADRSAHQRAEQRTDDCLLRAYSAISGDQTAAFVAGTEAMYAALT